jgi:dienelactone hydrolase
MSILRSLTTLVAAAALSLGTSCAHYPADRNPRPAQPLPQDVRDYYGYRKETIDAKLKSEHRADGYARRTYTFTAYTTRGEPHEVRFSHYIPDKPAEERGPAVFLTQFLGGKLPAFIPEIFLEEGWQALVVEKPRPRLKPEMGGKEFEEGFRDLVKDYRRCIDWLCQQPGVDPERLGSLGVSMGSIVNVVLSAVDRDEHGTPRLKHNVYVMPGDNLSRLLLDSDEGMVRQYLEGRQKLTGQTPREISEDLAKHLRSDPKYLAKHINPDEVLLFLARYDQVIPAKYGWSLRERLGNPETYVAPTGHYTFILTQYPFSWLGGKLKEHFHERFDRK